MPLCNGYDATHHIRNSMEQSDVIIIALTADSTNDAKKRKGIERRGSHQAAGSQAGDCLIDGSDVAS
jgi:CheY-like chemotaxis protein